MNTLIRSAGIGLAGAVLAGTGLFGLLPMTAAHAGSPAVSPQVTPAAVCSDTGDDRWICFLRYCDSYYCYYDCYPTLTARNMGEKPSETVRVPKPEGKPPTQITRP
ncbi:hypothetical protein ACFY3V_19650 [Streptosporangium sp. NPDC000095]|uniref:hypothetical protein n=1 Tax=Streptosporangium sp. NPDC000095 TaxID=3366184 RepID=UPI0036D13054